ncbi:MAG: ferritin-like domain-containing protein [Zestosphaera sp.]
MKSPSFEDMSKLEKEYSKRLVDSAKNVKNLVVKTVMTAVAQDSLKHSMIYEAIAELLKEERPMISETELDEIASEIEHHIRTEEEMIKYLREVLEKGVENKAMKFFLETLLRDELYHHALLKQVLEMIVRKEALTESNLWELVWREAMFHGTPGG